MCLHTCSAIVSPDFIRVDFDVLAVRSYGLPLLITLERLAHVERIGAIVVIVSDSAVNRIPVESVSTTENSS